MTYSSTPLAERMRPRNLDQYVGQEHLVGEGQVLRRALNEGLLPSIILWGPPGTGKTTLAQLIAAHLKRPFHALSAIHSGVKDIREIVDKSSRAGMFATQSPILFVDEIHRFSKSQQDSLLPAVEKGIVTLIGATTENPSFEVNRALLSRCQVYTLNSLTKEQLLDLANRALNEDPELSTMGLKLTEANTLLRLADGDARKLLNALEVVTANLEDNKKEITDELVETIVGKNLAAYDKAGDQHYDIASALIKSIRGSDPNAAMYYLARMFAGGEDPKFIARRLVISASEDIGIANPTALVIAQAGFDASHVIGYPECEIVLAEVVIYLATSPKSNASYTALHTAKSLVAATGNLPVPMQVRNAPTSLMKDLGYGKGYQYAHQFENNFAKMNFLPEEIEGTPIFIPGSTAKEKELAVKLTKMWEGHYDFGVTKNENSSD